MAFWLAANAVAHVLCRWQGLGHWLEGTVVILERRMAAPWQVVMTVQACGIVTAAIVWLRPSHRQAGRSSICACEMCGPCVMHVTCL